MTEQQPTDLRAYRAQLRFDVALVCTLERPPPVPVSAGPVGVAVTLTGELDLSSVDGLDRCLRDVQAHNGRVVLDLRRLAFMDSAGLRAIFAARQRAARAGREIEVLSAPGQVQRMLDLCGVDRLIDTPSPPMVISGSVVQERAAADELSGLLEQVADRDLRVTGVTA